MSTDEAALGDRSVPRSRLRAGDETRDGRGRHRSAPTFLRDGFRPFFLAAALYAAIGIPAWLAMLGSGVAPDGPFPGLAWHAHEMLFGYLGAVLAGFILTAIPNWTGRLPLSGLPLAGLVGLWAAGRVASTFNVDPLAAMLIDLAFPAALLAAVWREVVAGRNWRNAPIALLLTLYGAANALYHLEMQGLGGEGLSQRMALAVAALLMALVGGRIVPSFTRNWLARRQETLPASFGMIDKLALAATAGALLLLVGVPDWEPTGMVLIAAGLLLALRLARWRGLSTAREPILFVLHAGYAWLALSLVCLGIAVFTASAEHGSAALHALTAGAVGTMTLAVMTRASLGHTGRPIVADAWTMAIYAAVTLGAVLRVVASFEPGLLIPAGLLWSFAFALFAVRYAPILTGRRAPA